MLGLVFACFRVGFRLIGSRLALSRLNSMLVAAVGSWSVQGWYSVLGAVWIRDGWLAGWLAGCLGLSLQFMLAFLLRLQS